MRAPLILFCARSFEKRDTKCLPPYSLNSCVFNCASKRIYSARFNVILAVLNLSVGLIKENGCCLLFLNRDRAKRLSCAWIREREKRMLNFHFLCEVLHSHAILAIILFPLWQMKDQSEPYI